MFGRKYSSSIIEEDRNTFHDNLDEIKIEKYKKYMYINKKGE